MAERFKVNSKPLTGKDGTSHIQHAFDDILNEKPVEKPKELPIENNSSDKIVPFRRPSKPPEDEDKNDAWSDLGYTRRR